MLLAVNGAQMSKKNLMILLNLIGGVTVRYAVPMTQVIGPDSSF